MPLKFNLKEQRKALKARMRSLAIFEKDLDEQFVRSSGKGGQNVNKVSTCVVLYHRLTRIRVKCQKERTQALNRLLARELLCCKVERQIKEKREQETREKEKALRQKRKKPARIKEAILEDKRRQSLKKQNRQRISTRKFFQEA